MTTKRSALKQAPTSKGPPVSAEEHRRLLTEIGSSGLRRQTGMVFEEFLPDLQGVRAVRVFREMADNDPVIGAELFAIEQVILSSSWTWRAANDSNEAHAVRDFFAGATEDMSHTWRDFLSEALSMMTYGWALHELVYKIRRGPEQEDPSLRSRFTDGKFGWRKIALRAQETLSRWDFDEEGGIRGMVQIAPPDYNERHLSIEKSLLFRTKIHKNNPEGRSVLRNAYRPWYFGKRIEEIEAIGIERDLAGLPIATPPEEYNLTAPENADQVEYVKNLLRNVRRDEQEGILKPTGWEFILLSTGGRRAIDTDATVARYNRLKAMTVLAQFIMLGTEKVGSYSLAITHEDLFLTAVSGWLTSIGDVINRHAVPRLGALNGFPLDLLPRAEPSPIREPKVAELGKFLADAVGVGIITADENLEQHLRSLAKLPAKVEEKVRKRLLTRAELEVEEERAKGKRQVGLLDLVE